MGHFFSPFSLLLPLYTPMATAMAPVAHAHTPNLANKGKNKNAIEGEEKSEVECYCSRGSHNWSRSIHNDKKSSEVWCLQGFFYTKKILFPRKVS